MDKKKVIIFITIFSIFSTLAFAAQKLSESLPVEGVTSGPGWATTINQLFGQLNISYFTSNSTDHIVFLGNTTFSAGTNITLNNIGAGCTIKTDPQNRAFCGVDNNTVDPFNSSISAWNYTGTNLIQRLFGNVSIGDNGISPAKLFVLTDVGNNPPRFERQIASVGSLAAGLRLVFQNFTTGPKPNDGLSFQILGYNNQSTLTTYANWGTLFTNVNASQEEAAMVFRIVHAGLSEREYARLNATDDPKSANGVTVYFQTANGADLALIGSSGLLGIKIQSNGYVAIGQLTANDSLDVLGNARFSGSVNASFFNATNILLRNGTLSLPSYSFIEDSDTGIINNGKTGNNISFVTGGSARMTIDSNGNIGIGTTAPAALFDVVGNIRDSNTITGNIFADYTDSTYYLDPANTGTSMIVAGKVGIGTTSPSEILTVVGNINVSGFGYFMNNILINGSPVLLSKDFNLGNISNHTEFIKSSNFNLGNISNYTQFIKSVDFNLGNISNYSQFVKGTDFNLANISNYSQFIKSVDFNLGNISNYSQFINGVDFGVTKNISNYSQFVKSSDFNLGNISNNSITPFNSSIALWNITNGGTFTFINPNVATWLVRIGSVNLNFTGNDTLAIGGSVAVYGSLNATFINATAISIGNTIIPLNGFFNLANYSTEYASTGFKLVNYSNEYSGTGFRIGNYSSEYSSTGWKLGNDTSAGFIQGKDFSVKNISNNTVTPFNSSIALWNITYGGTLIYINPVNSNWTVRIGNININTSINDTLAVAGSVAIYGSLNATFINATTITVGTTVIPTIGAFNLANYSTEYASTGFNLGNYSTQYANTGFKLGNYSTEYGNTGFKLSNYSAEYASTGWKLINGTAAGFVQGKDFNIANVSNYSQFIKGADFNKINFTSIGNIVINTTATSFAQNFTSYGSNSSLGNFSIFQYNSTCSGFRHRATGGIIASCDN